MIVSMRPEHFFKCQNSIEKANLKTPSPKILVMDNTTTHRNSHVSGLLLRSYYAKIERNPLQGLSDGESNAFIKSNQDEEGMIECEYCKNKVSHKVITIDHFKPKVFKGANQLFNVRLACKACNESKGAIYPARMPQTFNLYLEKMKAGSKVSCLDIVQEAKATLSVCEIELSLLNRIIGMELKWRKDLSEKKALTTLDAA